MKKYFNFLTFKVVEECDLIFLCIQPHQLDLLMKEIYQTLSERMEKLRKKKSKIFPTFISMLSGITLDKLKSLFPEDVNFVRTSLNPEIKSYFDDIYSPKNDEYLQKANEENKKKLEIIKNKSVINNEKDKDKEKDLQGNKNDGKKL